MKTIILSCLFTLTLLAQAPANTNKYPAKRPATPAAPTGASNARLMNPAALKAVAPAEYKVKFTTTKGDFVLEVHRDWAPLGADRFYNLVRNGYFDNARFFRAVKGFMVQFGISGRPDVNRAWVNANLKDDPVKESNKRGYISFASAGPNTRTTQVFINLVD